MYLWSNNAYIAFPGAENNFWVFEIKSIGFPRKKSVVALEHDLSIVRIWIYIWEYEVECVLSNYKIISKVMTGNIDIIIIPILPTLKCT